MPKNGFTLIELLVSIAIVGLVAGIVISSASSIQRSSRDATRKTDLASLKSALQQYYADQNYYPDNLNLSTATSLTNCTGYSGTCTVSKTYISITPKDPVSTTNYCYKSKVSSDNSNNCGPGLTGQCHFYSLCAKLENPGSNPSTCDCNSSYNYQVTPL